MARGTASWIGLLGCDVSRTLKTDMPGPDRRVGVAEAREKGWRAVFAPDVAEPLPLVVELGFGRGEFLRALAAAAPDAAHVGVDRSRRRAWKLARRIAKSDERNVRLVEATAEELVTGALDDASVATFWINFPDPWPKKRHHRRRLLQPGFVGLLATRLVPGGLLHAATDHAGYAEQIDAVLAGEPRLENALPAPFLSEMPGRLCTAYEAMWRAEGRALHFFTYRRRSSP
jgi:tRNA (guanine-N7-)-methyltransferase